MKVAVVMATYNGSKFINEQMCSINEQTRKPDEVIFCDDGSTDNTVMLIHNYIKKNNLENWKVIKNKHMGVTKNFYYGIGMAESDIIFISDQDDIWKRNKIEIMIKPFSDATVKTVTCRKNLIDTFGKPIKSYPDCVINPKVKKSQGRFLSFDEELKYRVSSGLCLAFKKEFFSEVEKFVNKYNLLYDIPFGIVASMNGGDFTINESLVLHRIHTNNVSKPINSAIERKGKSLHQIESHKYKLELLIALSKEYYNFLDYNQRDILEETIQLHKQSINALEKRSVFQLFKLLFYTNKGFNKFMSIADIISVL